MKNDVTLHDGCAIIHIVLPDGRRRDAVVDAEDFDKVKGYRWRAERHLGSFAEVSSAQAAYEPFRQARLADPSDSLPWSEFKAQVLRGCRLQGEALDDSSRRSRKEEA